MKNQLRRDFLKGLGASAALAPFLPFLDRQAAAQQSTFPRRLLLLFTPNGTVPSRYWPTGGENDFTFPAGQITEPLAPFRAKMIYAKGMSRPRAGGGGHESAFRTMWTGAGQTGSGGGFGGYAAGPSIDQIIAKALPMGPTFPSLQFGVQHNGPGANPSVLTVMTYAAAGQPLAPESNPYKMFDRLMLGSDSSPTGLTPEALDKVRARRKSVIDLVSEEIRAVAPRIDRGDRLKLEQHLQGLSAIEKRLNTPQSPGTGGKCGGPKIRPMIDLASNESFPELLGIQNSLAVAALACDLTRVASMQWSRSFSQVRHTWAGVSAEHHTLSHMTSATNQQQKYQIDRWYHERMAEFLKQLDSVPEGNGTLLDNTMVLFCNDLAEGAPHSVAPAICWVAGKGGGKLKTGTNGRFLELGGSDFTQMMVTAAHVMGVTSVTKVGSLGKEGDIPALLA
jgi:hypothetical protein